MRFKLNKISIALLILALAVAFTACDPSSQNSAADPTIKVPITGGRTIQLFVTPATIPADGVSAAYIVAVCKIGGQPATDGLPVTFRTDKGGFSTNGVEHIEDGEKTLIFNGSTVSGSSAIYLISEDVEGIASVSAVFANNVSSATSVEFGKSIKDVAAIELKANPSTGNSPLNTAVEAILKDSDNELIEGVLVRFRIDDPGARFSQQRVKSDINGKAQTNLSNVTKDSILTATAGGKTAQYQLASVTIP